jgi:alpha-glucosidase
MKKVITVVLALFVFAPIFSQKKQNFQLVSPNGKIAVTIELSDKITWTIANEKETVLSASPMSMTLNESEILGKNPMLLNSKKESIRTSFETPLYKKESVQDNYNQLLLNFKSDFSIEYRAFDEGVAYRFITKKKKDITVKSEEAQKTHIFPLLNRFTKTKKSANLPKTL